MHEPVLKSKWTGITLAAAVLFLSSLACSGIPFLSPTPTPTATTTPTATSTPTSTDTPTVTQTLTPSPTRTDSYLDWLVVLTDSFDDNTNNWFVGESTDEYIKTVVSITGGRYLIDATAVTHCFLFVNPPMRNLDDFYLTADVEKISGATNSDYGLAFRIFSDKYSYFGIATEQQDYIFEVFNNGKWRTIIEWPRSSQINRSGSNHIGVLAKGTSFSFFINDEMVDQIEDSTLKTGKVGVALGLANAGDNAQIAFDNFEVRAPK